MKTKFNDNKLAEEWDVIVLTDDSHKQNGLPRGSLGTLVLSYSTLDKPLYGAFALADGTTREEKLDLYGFRVLDLKNERDFSLFLSFLKENTRKNA